MARKVKVLSITEGMNLECVKIIPHSGEKEHNPYRLFLLYHARDKYGYPTRHRKQIAKYGDFYSIICHVKDIQVVAGLPVESILEWNRRYCGE